MLSTCVLSSYVSSNNLLRIQIRIQFRLVYRLLSNFYSPNRQIAARARARSFSLYLSILKPEKVLFITAVWLWKSRASGVSLRFASVFHATCAIYARPSWASTNLFKFTDCAAIVHIELAWTTAASAMNERGTDLRRWCRLLF